MPTSAMVMNGMWVFITLVIWAAKARVVELFDFISGGKLKWAEMDPVYDRIILGDEKFDFVAGKENFKNSLKEQFPDDVDAIDKYVELVTRHH